MTTAKVAADFARYHTYDEITAYMRALADAYPRLATLVSIGTSHGGRNLWLMALTNQATGHAEEKPALYIDGNCHGEEVIASEAALYTVWYALTHYGQDDFVTQLLDTRALYILPRANPDGAEWSLTTPYHHVGNGHYPFWEEPLSGHREKDLNGDGHVTDMRVVDPGGEWKVSEKDPRLMVMREPGEIGGTYYRLYPEGEIVDYDGLNVRVSKPRHGNLNRQYPANWGPEEVEYGAGDVPLNEPEAQAIAHFIVSHPNITGAQAYHSHAGCIISQLGALPGEAMPDADRRLIKWLGEMGARLTGYPLLAPEDNFSPAGTKNVRHGSFTTWLYAYRGIIPYTVEFWDVETEAGIPKTAIFMERGRDEEELLKLLAWADANFEGQGYFDWQPFDHPQLGPVEIGGWNHMYVFRNPPPKYIEGMAHNSTLFALRHAASSPLLRIQDVKSERVAPGIFTIRAVVANEGCLSTYLTEMALNMDKIPGVKAVLESGAGVELVLGPRSQDLGHLAGYWERRDPWNAWGPSWNDTRRRVEWQVRVPIGQEAHVRVVASSPTGGRTSTEIVLAA